MAIDNATVIDAIGEEKMTGDLVLTISDHLDWNNERDHLQALQDKINAYFDFIQSGQIYEERPEARERAIRIDVIAQFPAPASVASFFHAIEKVAVQNGAAFTYKQLPSGY